MTDRNFDNLADKFEQRIHGSFKGRLREDQLWWQMQTHMPELLGAKPLRILDAGGGLGQMALRLARLGHQVTLNDISAAMLERARICFAVESPAVGEIRIHQGPVQSLSLEHHRPFDAIVCHALLEWLADPRLVLQHLFGLLRPGGKMSLAFYNRHALVYANARKGNVQVLLPGSGTRKPRRKGLSPRNAQYPETVLDWLVEWDLRILGRCGIRVLSDWLPAAALETVDYDHLLAIERHYAAHTPYSLAGRYYQLLVEKPGLPHGGARHA